MAARARDCSSPRSLNSRRAMTNRWRCAGPHDTVQCAAGAHVCAPRVHANAGRAACRRRTDAGTGHHDPAQDRCDRSAARRPAQAGRSLAASRPTHPTRPTLTKQAPTCFAMMFSQSADRPSPQPSPGATRGLIPPPGPRPRRSANGLLRSAQKDQPELRWSIDVRCANTGEEGGGSASVQRPKNSPVPKISPRKEKRPRSKKPLSR